MFNGTIIGQYMMTNGIMIGQFTFHDQFYDQWPMSNALQWGNDWSYWLDKSLSMMIGNMMIKGDYWFDKISSMVCKEDLSLVSMMTNDDEWWPMINDE